MIRILKSGYAGLQRLFGIKKPSPMLKEAVVMSTCRVAPSIHPFRLATDDLEKSLLQQMTETVMTEFMLNDLKYTNHMHLIKDIKPQYPCYLWHLDRVDEHFDEWIYATEYIHASTYWSPGCLPKPTKRPDGTCCNNEQRNINGGCDNCGDPCL